jgi:hypothetical protein
VAFRSVPRPSSPPGAKASTECPSHAPVQRAAVRLSVTSGPMIGDQWISDQDNGKAVFGSFLIFGTTQDPERSVPLGERSISGSFYTHASEHSTLDWRGARAVF